MARQAPNEAHAPKRAGARTRIIATGLVAAAAWGAFYLFLLWPVGTGLAGLIAGIVPIALIAGATLAALSLNDMRAEAAALRLERDRLRDALTTPARKPAPQGETSAAVRSALRPADGPQAQPAPAAVRVAAQPNQGALPLGAENPTPLTLPDLIRALHFPETPDDRDGLRAMQRALRDHKARLVVQAAQDMLTLLSQDSVYVDDLDHDRASTDLWRRFAGGDRRVEVMAVGGVRDPDALALCRKRLRDNTVWRDTAHHFLRRFDQMLGGLVPELDDAGIEALSETRSARAFMLVGRAAEVFGPDPDGTADATPPPTGTR